MNDKKTDQEIADVLSRISEVAKRIAKRFIGKGEDNGNQN